MGYFIDSLFRKDMNAAVAASAAAANGALAGAAAGQALAASRSEVTRIFMNTVRTDALPAEDIQYVFSGQGIGANGVHEDAGNFGTGRSKGLPCSSARQGAVGSGG